MNAEAEGEDEASVLSWYRSLASFRAENPVLLDGTYGEILADSEEIYAYVRENESDRLVILVNFTGGEAAYEPEEAGIDDNENTVLLMSNYGGTDGRIGVLRPYESVILRAAK